MAQTIEDVNDRTLLQQFHSLYKKQDEIETNVENVDSKVEQEKSDRQSADAGLQKLIYQEATEIGNETAGLRNDMNTNTAKIEYNSTQISALKSDKQDKLTAGTNITIDENNVISASGGVQVYTHNLIQNYGEGLNFVIINNNSSTLTTADIATYLYTNGFTSSTELYPTLSIFALYNSKISHVAGIYSSDGTKVYATRVLIDASFNQSSEPLSTGINLIAWTDKVTEL